MSSHVSENQSCNSKFIEIFTCLFFRKKTDVVAMKKEESVVEKKQMSVDRSERSRRVLKIESLRAAPKSKIDGTDIKSQGSNHMFLPSENPSASFLSTLTPFVRRTCSEVIRTTNAPLHRLSKEAFTDSGRRIKTRNTNYRSQHATEKLGSYQKNKCTDDSGIPLKQVARNDTMPMVSRKPVVVPGITTCSNDDIGLDSIEYDTDSEVMDLHEEMRRLNLCSPDMRSATKSKRLATTTKHRITHRKGSISEISEIGGEKEAVVDIPYVAGSVLTHEGTDLVRSLRKDNKLENDNQQSARPVINNFFTQSQNNSNVLFTTKMDSMDIEMCRSYTASPDTCIRHLEHESPVGKKFRNIQVTNSGIIDMKRQTNGLSPEISKTNILNNDMDRLLAEVSVRTHERQNCSLEDGKLNQLHTNTREKTITSLCTDDGVIDEVSKSNSYTCNNWVGDIEVDINQSTETSSKLRGILTKPRLFRTLSYSASGIENISDNDNDGKTYQNNAQDQPKESISNKGTSSAYLGKGYDSDSIDDKTSQQIIRNAHVTYLPFMNLNRDDTPKPVRLNIDQMVRNSQVNSLQFLTEVTNNDTFIATPDTRNSDNSRGSRSMNSYQYDTTNHTPKQTLENTVHSNFGNYSDNVVLASRQFPTNGTDLVLRPVSETMHLKEANKVNIGTSAAVKSKDTMHPMDKQVFVLQQATLQKTHMPKNKTNTDQADQEGNAQNDNQRNELFTSSPPYGGGYSYSKNTIQHTLGATKSGRGKHIFDFATEKGVDRLFDRGLAARNCHSIANINDLSFNLRNSTGYKTKFISFREPSQTYKATDTANVQQVNNDKHQSNVQGGNIENMCPFINKNAAVQVHTHGVQVKMNEASNITPTTLQTTNKYKRLRSRRDQDMEWLMPVAVETEV